MFMDATVYVNNITSAYYISNLTLLGLVAQRIL